MEMNKTTLWAIACVVLTAIPVARAEGDELAEKARGLGEQYDRAIVHVEAVVKISATGGGSIQVPEQEQKVKVLGTVIDPSGLTVVAFLDPTAAMGKMKLNAGGRVIELTLKGEIREVKYRLTDGTELPGRLVLTDDDLSLAFVAPAKPLDAKTRKRIAHVDLSKAAGKGSVLDRIITLGRLGKTLNHTLTISVGRIAAVVTKPRTFYIGAGSLGSPVFAADGKLLGICTRRIAKGQGRSVNMMGGRRGMNLAGGAPVILPAGDVQEIADQARDEIKKAKTD